MGKPAQPSRDEPGYTGDVWWAALLVSASNLAQSLIQLIALVLVFESQSVEALAGVTLAFSLFNLVMAVPVGLCTSLGETIAQVVTSDALSPLPVLFFRRSLAVALAVMTPVALAFLLPWWIAPTLAQDTTVAAHTGQVLLWLALALPPAILFEYSKCFVLSYERGRMASLGVTALSTALATILHTFVCPWLVRRWGVSGAAISVAAAYTLPIVFMMPMVYRTIPSAPLWLRGGDFIHAPDSFNDRGWVTVLRNGAPEMTLALSSRIPFELAVISAGWISIPMLAAQGLARSILAVVGSVPLLVSQATTLVVGDAMVGRQRRDHIDKVVSHAMELSCVSFTVTALLLLGSRSMLSSYSSQRDVVDLLRQAILAIALYQVPDSLYSAALGVIRGAAMSEVANRSSMLSHFIIGIPCSLYLLSTYAGVQGYWLGLTAAQCVNAGSLMWVTFSIDWESEELSEVCNELMPINPHKRSGRVHGGW